MYYYAITIKKTVPINSVKQAETVIKRYDNIIRYVKSRNPKMEIKVTLENKLKKNGKYNVHLHGMIKTPDQISISIFPKEKGIHFYIEETRSKLAYNAYMNSGQIKREDIYDQIEVNNMIQTKEEYDEDKELMDKIRRIRLV